MSRPDTPEAGRLGRAVARPIVWLRFVLVVAVVAVAGVTYERLPGVSSLPSSPLTGLIPENSPAIAAEGWMLHHFRGL